jgi:hypothetical protein
VQIQSGEKDRWTAPVRGELRGAPTSARSNLISFLGRSKDPAGQNKDEQRSNRFVEETKRLAAFWQVMQGSMMLGRTGWCANQCTTQDPSLNPVEKMLTFHLLEIKGLKRI